MKSSLARQQFLYLPRIPSLKPFFHAYYSLKSYQILPELLIGYKRGISRSLDAIFMSMNWWRWASLGWTDFAETVLFAHCLWFGGRRAMIVWIRWNYFLIWRMSFFLADSGIFSEISMTCPLHLNQQDQLFLWAFLLYGYRCRMLKWFWMGFLAKTWRSNGYRLFRLLLHISFGCFWSLFSWICIYANDPFLRFKIQNLWATYETSVFELLPIDQAGQVGIAWSIQVLKKIRLSTSSFHWKFIKEMQEIFHDCWISS